MFADSKVTTRYKKGIKTYICVHLGDLRLKKVDVTNLMLVW